jgi:hypothetical protein
MVLGGSMGAGFHGEVAEAVEDSMSIEVSIE